MREDLFYLELLVGFDTLTYQKLLRSLSLVGYHIASHNKPPPTLIKKTLEKLSMMPARLEELKKSAARAGVLTALTWAKSWISDLDPEDIGNGYPNQKEDGSDFDNDDLRAIMREMRPLASKLAEDTDLSFYQSTYDADNKRLNAPTYDVHDLIPPIRKAYLRP